MHGSRIQVPADRRWQGRRGRALLGAGALLLVAAGSGGMGACTSKALVAPSPDDGGADTLVSFTAQVVPLLTNRYGCAAASCHGGSPPASGYALPDHATIFGPGVEARDRGLLDVRPGRPDSSFIIWKLEGRTPSGEPLSRMPRGRPDPIAAADLDLIRIWIRQGALDN